MKPFLLWSALTALALAFTGFSLLALLAFALFGVSVYLREILRAIALGNRPATSAPPDSRPTQPPSQAARNAPTYRASLSTLNPHLFLN